MTPERLKVSQAGYDVTTNSGAQLLLNTDYAVMQIYMEGSLSIPVVASGASGFQGYISYGKTYPSPPFVQFDVIMGGKRLPLTSMRGLYGDGQNFVGGFEFWFDLYVEALTDSIGYRARKGRGGSGTAFLPDNGNPVLVYRVMEFNL
jgi:hypothetical protein